MPIDLKQHGRHTCNLKYEKMFSWIESLYLNQQSINKS